MTDLKKVVVSELHDGDKLIHIDLGYIVKVQEKGGKYYLSVKVDDSRMLFDIASFNLNAFAHYDGLLVAGETDLDYLKPNSLTSGTTIQRNKIPELLDKVEEKLVVRLASRSTPATVGGMNLFDMLTLDTVLEEIHDVILTMKGDVQEW